jgi:hypothetical protein
VVRGGAVQQIALLPTPLRSRENVLSVEGTV